MSNNIYTDIMQALIDIQDSQRPGRKFFKRVVCADGFSVSVQASNGNYCTPRNDVGPWSSVELGFPNGVDSLLQEWAEDPGAEQNEEGFVETVYGWVPSQVVMKIIESHGGMVDGELPDMIPDEDYEEEE